jgi:hypothetical protein
VTVADTSKNLFFNVQIVEQYKKNSDLIWNFVLTRFLIKNCTDKKKARSPAFSLHLDIVGRYG